MVLLALSGLALAVAYRTKYGAWLPAAPDRIDVCGRRFYESSVVVPQAPKTLNLRRTGRTPPLVGWKIFEGRQFERGTSCVPDAVVRETADGSWRIYELSGSQ